MTSNSAKKRAVSLAIASKYVTQDRNTEAGEPEDNFATIAAFWNTYDRAHGRDEDLPHDVAIKMILVKISRIAQSPEKLDHWVDIMGYGACGVSCIVSDEDVATAMMEERVTA